MVEPGDGRLAAGRGRQRISAVISDPLPPDALAINVEGKQLTGPDDGFGTRWRKTYVVSLAGANVSPEGVITAWRDHFGEFWPSGSRFYRPAHGIEPGAIALADIALPAGSRLSTGVATVARTDHSFTFVTTQGHMLAGTITFSARDDNGTTVAQVETVMRAGDPLYELAMPLAGHRHENRFWEATLTALARHLGVEARPTMSQECLDRRRRWRNAGNIVHNAFIRTALYLATRPVRRLASVTRARTERS